MSAERGERGWDQTRRAHSLIARRERFLRRLPRLIRAASRLSEDLREYIVDESIQFAALHYERPVASDEELERVFWDACAKRVRRACEGRYETVRGAYVRADIATLDALASDADPEDEVLRRAEWRVALEFAARLAPIEQRVWSCHHGAPASRRLGHASIARRLGLPVATVRSALDAIEAKRERFAAIYAAGRLCGSVAPAVAALAAGGADAREEAVARAHLDACRTCRADYARHLRYLRSARFAGKVGALLPAPLADDRVRVGGLRDLLVDWIARIGDHVPAQAAAGAGRGIASSAAAKVAALCLVGAIGTRVATGVLPTAPAPRRAPAHTAATPAPAHRRRTAEPPHAAAIATATARPTSRRRTRGDATSRTTQGGTGPRSHERTPASPAPSNAPADGAGEFDPEPGPSRAQPAPVPAAPGGREFF